MWIALAVVAFLVLLITVICLLPVKIIIKNDSQNLLILRYKFLFKTFGENPNPNDPIVKTLKKAAGVDRLEKSINASDLKEAVSGSYSILIDMLKEVVALLKRCVISRLRVYIRCVGDDPALTALHYGQCCAITHSLLNTLYSFLKIRRRGCDIDIGCDFQGSETVFCYDIILTISLGRVLAGFGRLVLSEVKRG